MTRDDDVGRQLQVFDPDADQRHGAGGALIGGDRSRIGIDARHFDAHAVLITIAIIGMVAMAGLIMWGA